MVLKVKTPGIIIMQKWYIPMLRDLLKLYESLKMDRIGAK
jgi:hypothetical protein